MRGARPGLDMAHLETASHSMARLNRAASQAARAAAVRSATDITGFGLLGHGAEMVLANGTQMGVRIRAEDVPLAEIAQHGHVLTPGRYVGAEEVEDDDEAFADKMQTLTAKLGEQMAKGAELDALIRQKLGGLGYEF